MKEAKNKEDMVVFVEPPSVWFRMTAEEQEKLKEIGRQLFAKVFEVESDIEHPE